MVDSGYQLMVITNKDRWSGRAQCWDNFIVGVSEELGDEFYSWDGEAVDMYIASCLEEWNGWTVDIDSDDEFVTEFALWFKTETDATQFLLRWA